MKRYLVLWLLCFLSFESFSQPYGNEWIKYDQAYVRIGVLLKGVNKVKVSELPASFANADPSTFQLWHRGREIPLISATASEIKFYGEPNDGESDYMVYRPSNARLNPYISLFSDEASYFLTLSKGAARISTKDGSQLLSNRGMEYHFQRDVKTYTNQFAFSTFGIDELLNNSFYEAANSYTSGTIWGPNAASQYVSGVSYLDANLLLKNYYEEAKVKPVLEVLFNGLNTGAHNANVYLGKDDKSNSFNLVGVAPFSGYDGKKIQIELDKEGILGNSDSAVLRFSTVSESNKDWVGLSYFTITYPQLADMSGLTSAYFKYKPSDQKSDRIRIQNVPSSAQVFDISDPYNPTLISGKRSGITFEVQVDRKDGKELILFVNDSSQSNLIPVSRIYGADFNAIYASPSMPDGTPKSPTNYDFLIVTHSKLESSSIDYAKYRSSDKGGSRKVLLVDIRKIYDEFNFGEPSPIAIRKFVNFMLSKGIRNDKHNLLLIGHSVSWSTRLVKEMPGEVPTFGDPGADMLLVSGLNGRNPDMPAIPVGRINAFSNQEVLNYLAKVDTYEHEGDTGWRKNILHLNGGHSVSEINQLKTLLSDLVPDVENGVIEGGTVHAFVKKQGISETEKVNISAEVNNGAGMITYFGHGSQSITDLDMGYVSDAARGYSNSKRYPLMFFNGCGVGNIFASRLSHTLSSDWLLTPNKGAIAVVSNSYKSYISPSSKHLNELYKQIFLNVENQSIGQTLLSVAKNILASNANVYDIANLHQSYIQGDPSIIALRSSKPDFVIAPEGSLSVSSESPNITIGNSRNIKTSAIIRNEGRLEYGKEIILEFAYHYANGQTKKFNQRFLIEQVQDTIYHETSLDGRLDRIEVMIDPDKNLTELSINNNYASLDIDWDKAKDQFFYFADDTIDIVPPILTVFYDDRMMSNNESVLGGRDFKFVVRDDKYLSTDGEYIEVYIKNCNEDGVCNFIEIPSSQLVFSQHSNREFEVIYSTHDLVEGAYQLLVSVRDEEGNSANKPYLINFEVLKMGNSDFFEIICSPNPATDYIKFNINSFAAIWKEYSLVIYNNLGVEVKEFLNQEPKSESFEIYWKPEVISGLYVYKFKGSTVDNKLLEKSGKVVIIK